MYLRLKHKCTFTQKLLSVKIEMLREKIKQYILGQSGISFKQANTFKLRPNNTQCGILT